MVTVSITVTVSVVVAVSITVTVLFLLDVLPVATSHFLISATHAKPANFALVTTTLLSVVLTSVAAATSVVSSIVSIPSVIPIAAIIVTVPLLVPVSATITSVHRVSITASVVRQKWGTVALFDRVGDQTPENNRNPAFVILLLLLL